MLVTRFGAMDSAILIVVFVRHPRGRFLRAEPVHIRRG
jgi:hypothetical protein